MSNQGLTVENFSVSSGTAYISHSIYFEKKIINLKAKRLVYVSCNPATQARDTEQLMQAGYKIRKFSLVDQFPHTAHIETVFLFEKY